MGNNFCRDIGVEILRWFICHFICFEVILVRGKVVLFHRTLDVRKSLCCFRFLVILYNRIMFNTLNADILIRL